VKKQRFSMGELGSHASEVDSLKLGEGKNQRFSEGEPGARIFEPRGEALIRDLSGIGDQLRRIESRLRGAHAETSRISDLITEREYRLKVSKCGESLGELRSECLGNGMTAEDFTARFGASKDYVRRLKEGYAFPPKAGELPQMFTNLEGQAGLSEKTVVNPERRAALERSAEEAWKAREARQTLKKRIESTEVKLQRKADLEADLADCAGALRKKIASLKQQQAVSGGQGQSLRRRIELLEAALKRALARREAIKEELVACIIEVLKLLSKVKCYLDS